MNTIMASRETLPGGSLARADQPGAGPQEGDAMNKHPEGERAAALSRRQVLQAGLAVTAAGAIGPLTATAREPLPQAQTAGRSSGVRAVDIHAHYFPQRYLDLLTQAGRTAGNNDPRFTDARLRVAEMDMQGVAVHALSLTASPTAPMVYWGGADLSHALAQAWNDEALAAHQSYPARLLVLATLPMQFPDRALEELNRVAPLPGVRGVYMGTNIGGKDLDDPSFEPIFARIESLDLPVFLHPLNTVGGERTQSFYLTNFIGNPVDSAIAAAHLIFGGVLDRHPRLSFCLPHAGGVLPILTGRWDHGWTVRPEVKQLRQAPSAYLRRFFYDTISHSRPIMEFVIGMVGADRVMVGSDYCFDMGLRQPVEFVEDLSLTRAERDMILGGTAAKVLKL
jgi:aminocarboxymuconate-semialdehyde decarboxylase